MFYALAAAAAAAAAVLYAPGEQCEFRDVWEETVRLICPPLWCAGRRVTGEHGVVEFSRWPPDTCIYTPSTRYLVRSNRCSYHVDSVSADLCFQVRGCCILYYVLVFLSSEFVKLCIVVPVSYYCVFHHLISSTIQLCCPALDCPNNRHA